MSGENSNLYLPVKGKSKACFVTGLFWQVDPGGSAIKDEFKKGAAEFVANAGVYRKGETSQLGYFEIKDELKSYSSYYSLAGAVVSAIGERLGSSSPTFLLAAQLDENTWYYVSCRNGVILPEGDSTGTFEEIEVQFYSDLSLDGWDSVFTSEGLDSNSSTPILFEDICGLEKSDLDSSIKATLFLKKEGEDRKNFIIFLSVCLSLSAAFAGFQYWKKIEAKKQAELEYQALTASQQQVPVKPPWHLIPTAPGYTSACVKGLNKFLLSPAGWEMKEGSCAPSGAGMSWDKGSVGGSPAAFKRVVPNSKVGLDGVTASSFTPVVYDSFLEEDFDSLPDTESVSLKMTTLAHDIGMVLSLGSVPAPEPVLNPDGTVPAPIPWSVLKWSIQTGFSPSSVVRQLDDNGFRVKAISFSLQDGLPSWILEGVQYVK